MRIVSVNAWGGARYDDLAAWIPRSDAHVVCLQEVTRTEGQTGWTTFEDGERSLPQRANLFDDVRTLIPDVQSHFVASDAGPVTDAAGRRLRQDFGLGIFVLGHVEVLETATTFVHGEFAEHEEWTVSERPRAVQGLRALDPLTGSPVCIVHLHGLRDSAGKGDTPAREAQAARLAEFITSFRQPDDLVVVAGDLNLLPGSSTFDVLGEIGLIDLVGDADTRTS